MSDPTTLAVQQAINRAGYSPPLVEDGLKGPKTIAGIEWWQGAHGLTVDGIAGPATQASMGLAAHQTGVSTASNYVATDVAALKQAAKEKGYELSDALAALMIGQLRGAEGTMPGLTGPHATFQGTNNIGASQVYPSLASAKKTLRGWGAFAHYDTDPNRGAFLGWYWIAPSALEAAREWLWGNWWGKRLLDANPSDPTTYATILYRGKYFGGNHAGDDAHDPSSPAGAANVDDYAAAIRRGMPSAAEMAATPSNPAKTTVNPKVFASLSSRRITESLFDKAKSGGNGSAWSYLLPASWAEMQRSNGVVWFRGPPSSFGTWLGALVALGAVGWLVWRRHHGSV